MLNGTTSKKMNIIVCVALAVVLAITAFFFAMPAFIASGAEVKASKVYKSSDNVKYKGTDEGTEATLTGRADGSFSLNNTLYMDKYAADKDLFKLEFTIKSADFDRFILTFSTKNTDETKAEKVQNKVEFVNEDGKIEMRAVSGLLSDSDQKTIELIPTTADFNGAKVVLFYDKSNTYFKASINGGAEVVLNSGSNAVSFKDNEAELKFTMEGVDYEDEKTANIIINSIAGQSMVEGASGLSDTVDPLVIVQDGVYNKLGEKYLVGSKTNVKVPIKVYDVIQQLLTPNLTVKYGTETEEEKVDSSMNFYAKKVADIIVSVKVPTGVDNNTVDKEFIFSAIEDNTLPVIAALSSVISTYAPAGVEYNVKKPDVTDTSGIDTKENVEFILWYMTPSSTEWTKSSGLSFTPSSEGLYRIRLQAKDTSKHLSLVSDIMEIYFADEDAPKLTVTNFPKTAYIDEELALPSGSVSDTVDSSPTKTMKVYFVKSDTEKVEIELENGRFTPDTLGKYEVIYTAKDKANFVTTETKTFTVVVDDRPPVAPKNDFFNVWTITLICIAGVSLIGILLLLFVKPKKNKKKA